MRVAIIIVLLIALVLVWELGIAQAAGSTAAAAAGAVLNPPSTNSKSLPRLDPAALAAAQAAVAAYSAAAVATAKLLAPVISADFSQLTNITSMGITAPQGSAGPSKQAQADMTGTIQQVGGSAGAYADQLAAWGGPVGPPAANLRAGAVADFAAQSAKQLGALRAQLGVMTSYAEAWGGAIAGWVASAPASAAGMRMTVASSLSLPLNAAGRTLTAAAAQLNSGLEPALQAAVAASKLL